MPAPETAERLRARELRRDGLSVKEIARELGVSSSSVPGWIRDLGIAPVKRGAWPRGSPAHTAVMRRRYIQRQELKLDQANAVGLISERELLLVGAALYWAEGTKAKPWRPTQGLGFINSDPGMVRVFCRWLDLLEVHPSDRTYRVSINENADVAAAVTFWASVVGVAPDSFSPSLLKRHNPKTIRHNTGETYQGCLIVKVRRSTTLYRHVEGIWWAIAAAGSGFLRPAPHPLVELASLHSGRDQPGDSGARSRVV